MGAPSATNLLKSSSCIFIAWLAGLLRVATTAPHCLRSTMLPFPAPARVLQVIARVAAPLHSCVAQRVAAWLSILCAQPCQSADSSGTASSRLTSRRSE